MSQRGQYRKYRTRRRSSRTILAFNPTEREYGDEAKVLQRSLPDDAKDHRARAGAANSTSRSLCRRGAMPLMIWAASPRRFELRWPLAPGPMQERIHGLD